MINFNRKLLSGILVAGLLALSWSSSIRAEELGHDAQAGGEIYRLSRNSINVGDIDFKLSPTVKVTGNGKTSLKQLRIGDYVAVKLIKINGRKLVDTIYYLKK